MIDKIEDIPVLANGLSCPRCHSRTYMRNGKEKNIQRYKCKNCNKSFRKTTGTALHWIHKKKEIVAYVTHLADKQSLRKSARNVGISLGTSFAWRHKLLASLSESQTATTNKQVIVSILDLPFSAKGSRNHVEKPKKAIKNIVILGTHSVTIQKIQTEKNNQIREIRKYLKIELPNSTRILYRPNKQLSLSVRHQPLTTSINRLVHNSEVFVDKEQTEIGNIYRWLESFRGVSTKYLQQYWSWYQMWEHGRELKDPTPVLQFQCLQSNMSFTLFHEMRIKSH